MMEKEDMFSAKIKRKIQMRGGFVLKTGFAGVIMDYNL
jgi:hypothetical protein